MSDWLKNLKAGDKVIRRPVRHARGNDVLCDVTRTTSTLVFLSNGEKINKKTCHISPRPHWTEDAYLLDPVAEERRELLAQLRSGRYENATTDKLRRIVAILEEVKETP